MYDVRGVLPVDSLSPGTHLLGASPPMLGGRRLAYRFLARGLEAGDAGVIVTTTEDAETVAGAVSDHTDASLGRLGVVDAGGAGAPADGPYRVESVGSPADLTGIGIGLASLLDGAPSADGGGVRVVVDSLSTLLVYAKFERVYQFANVITGQLDDGDAASLFLLNSDMDGEWQRTFQGLFDGLVELREGDDAVEHRLGGLGGPTDWRPVADEGSAPEPGIAGGPTERESDGAAVEPPASLHTLIEQVTGTRYTLTVCNHAGDAGDLGAVSDHFERLDVAVRTAELSTDAPTGVAILHRGPEPLAMSPVEELRDGVRLDALETGTDLAETTRPAVLEAVDQGEYTVQNGGKLRMVRISRLMETRALDAGEGTLHAGFQRVSRVEDELGTRKLYERIASTDVDVHMYGRPGEVPNAEWYTLHTADVGELPESWFVVYDGAGTESRMGALVSEETAPEAYTGFWTYRSGIVGAVDTYLQSTYAEA